MQAATATLSQGQATDSDVPVLTAERVGNGFTVLVRCPFCGEYHRHGACGPALGDPDGRRCAHCRDADDNAEYRIRERRDVDPAMLEAWHNAYRRRRAREAQRKASAAQTSRGQCNGASSRVRRLMKRLRRACVKGGKA